MMLQASPFQENYHGFFMMNMGFYCCESSYRGIHVRNQSSHEFFSTFQKEANHIESHLICLMILPSNRGTDPTNERKYEIELLQTN